MQQDAVSSDSEQQNPDWVLASYGQRVGAWALDLVGSILTKILLIIVVLALVLRIRLSGLGSILEIPDWATAYFIFTAVVIGIGIGYSVWWLFALGHGQTPGKQIMGIRVIKENGEPSDWGYTFLREFVVKFLLMGLLSQVTFGIAWLVDYLWPLWDRAKKVQTLHDKLLRTIVVKVG